VRRAKESLRFERRQRVARTSFGIYMCMCVYVCVFVYVCLCTHMCIDACVRVPKHSQHDEEQEALLRDVQRFERCLI